VEHGPGVPLLIRIKSSTFWAIPPALAALWAPVGAVVYLSIEEALRTLFPGAGRFEERPARLSEGQALALEKSRRSRPRTTEVKRWRVWEGARPAGWVYWDQVTGKHEFITYAVGIGPDGAVRGVEILEYRESIGHEVRSPKWRSQFAGKTSRSPMKFDVDIRNISGATLSCRHVTDGVRRLLTTHDLLAEES